MPKFKGFAPTLAKSRFDKSFNKASSGKGAGSDDPHGAMDAFQITNSFSPGSGLFMPALGVGLKPYKFPSTLSPEPSEAGAVPAIFMASEEQNVAATAWRQSTYNPVADTWDPELNVPALDAAAGTRSAGLTAGEGITGYGAPLTGTQVMTGSGTAQLLGTDGNWTNIQPTLARATPIGLGGASGDLIFASTTVDELIRYTSGVVSYITGPGAVFAPLFSPNCKAVQQDNGNIGFVTIGIADTSSYYEFDGVSWTNFGNPFAGIGQVVNAATDPIFISNVSATRKIVVTRAATNQFVASYWDGAAWNATASGIFSNFTAAEYVGWPYCIVSYPGFYVHVNLETGVWSTPVASLAADPQGPAIAPAYDNLSAVIIGPQTAGIDPNGQIFTVSLSGGNTTMSQITAAGADNIQAFSSALLIPYGERPDDQ